MDSWRLRADPPSGLVRPVSVDPDGRDGPTKGQARGPRWRRTSTGLYVAAAVDRTRVEQRILEESCRLPQSGAVTGWAALRLHGAGYFDGLAHDGATLLPVPLVVPPGTALRQTTGTEVHRERLAADEVAERHGIQCTSPARAAFDAARRASGVRQAVVVLDMSLAARVLDRASFREYLSSRRGRPGIRQVLRAADLAEDRSKSPQESILRLVWRLDARLPAVRCNWPVADATGQFIGSPDLLCEDLAVVGEYDGAEHRARSRHRDDVRRDDLFRRVGLEPFRVVGDDLQDVALVVARIKAAVERARASGTPRTWRVQSNPGPVT
jgi:very-short-patch-repair endonuclease